MEPGHLQVKGQRVGDYGRVGSVCQTRFELQVLSAPCVHTTFASRGFSVATPAVWNSLPSGIRDASSTHTFRRLLRTHCFQQAFGSP